MASRTLLLSSVGGYSSLPDRQRQVRCSSAMPRRLSICRRTADSAPLLQLASRGNRAVTETHKDAVILSEDDQPKKGWVHFVGIGGSGLSALAMLALKQGYQVSGSDICWSSYMDDLHKAGAILSLGHSISCIETQIDGNRPDAIVISSAIPKQNVEIQYANQMGIPLYKRDSWLQNITESYNLIAIAGTHGKSTTAAMLSYVLHAMGDDLVAVVGANVPQFSAGNIISGTGPNFVLEADEYDCCFLALSPSIAVVTNVEWDHVDIFADEEDVGRIFTQFVRKIKTGGRLILCGDCAGAFALLKNCNPNGVTTYGISGGMDWRASDITPNSNGGQDYALHYRNRFVTDVSLKLPGVHNVVNSLAVVATIASLNKTGDEGGFHNTIDSVKYHLSKFEGVCRRFEFIGEVNGCCIYDDYAHHPTEVRATLEAARQKYPWQRLWVVFQPHTFSRITALMIDFVTAFDGADRVVVTEVYGAREENGRNSDGKELASLISGPEAEYIPRMEDAVDRLALEISAQRDEETVVFTLGAGDITTLGPKLFRRLGGISSKI